MNRLWDKLGVGLRGARRAMCAGLVIFIGPMSCAHAVDFAFSGFGTIGYARSDKGYQYQRFVDEDGTFKRDTIIGGQLDAKISPEWSATLQTTLAPSLSNDREWALKASWAFASWRPDNDWLLRLGRQRVPMYLNSENLEVGQTYDFARLPTEMYGISPTNDFNGLYGSHTWLPSLGELTVDLFGGETKIDARADTRDFGTIFIPVRTTVTGGVMTLKTDTATWRGGVHHTVTRVRQGGTLPSHYPFLDLGGGTGFYKTRDEIPFGPPVEHAAYIINDIFTLGMDVEVMPELRLVTEWARNVQRRTENGQNTTGGYVALLRKIDRFTPYVSYARLRSTEGALKIARNLDASSVPAAIPGADDINAATRAAADVIQLYDQGSLAIGTSYAVTPQSKLKVEWMRTHIGERSANVDSPPGGEPVRHQDIHILSLNYSFVF